MTEVQQTEKVTPRLKTKYREEIRGALQEQFQYGNVMQVPGLVKVVVNMGVGEAAKDSRSSTARSPTSPPSPARSR